jgi:hypothetical protein
MGRRSWLIQRCPGRHKGRDWVGASGTPELSEPRGG